MERRQGRASAVHLVPLRAHAQDHPSRGEDRLSHPASATHGLHGQLREATRLAHQRLESALDLLGEPVSAGRITGLLERFHGFHAAWEPALEGLVPPELLRPRLKLGLLEHDLMCLGVPGERLASLPACDQAAALCTTAAGAAGTLYVLEGSTLGGRVITRRLQQARWHPARQLLYWNPYGADTARRWSETLGYLQSLAPEASTAIVRSAVATFELLQAWLPPPPPNRGQTR